VRPPPPVILSDQVRRATWTASSCLRGCWYWSSGYVTTGVFDMGHFRSPELSRCNSGCLILIYRPQSVSRNANFLLSWLPGNALEFRFLGVRLAPFSRGAPSCIMSPPWSGSHLPFAFPLWRAIPSRSAPWSIAASLLRRRPRPHRPRSQQVSGTAIRVP
jgi:hypothetical protein